MNRRFGFLSSTIFRAARTRVSVFSVVESGWGFSPRKARKPHSRARKAIGKGRRNAYSIDKLPLRHASDLSTFSTRRKFANHGQGICLVEKVQIARVGYLGSVWEPQRTQRGVLRLNRRFGFLSSTIFRAARTRVSVFSVVESGWGWLHKVDRFEIMSAKVRLVL